MSTGGAHSETAKGKMFADEIVRSSGSGVWATCGSPGTLQNLRWGR